MIDYLASFVNTDGAAFPNTKSVNVSAPGAGDGTEFVKLMVDDNWGRWQAIMDRAGMVPDGVTEAVGTAQIIDALCHAFGIGPGIGVIYEKNDTPVVHGDRVLLKQGQEISMITYADLFAVVYCGDAANPTAPAYYATNGAGVRTLPGGGATHFVLPDARGLSLKMLGNATINGRTKVGPVELGEKQEDQFQGHRHNPLGALNFASFTAGQPIYAAGANGNYGDTTGDPVTDGTSGTPRIDVNTRDSSIGTNFGITY